MLNKKDYATYGESVWTQRMANGLLVKVVAKPDFYKTYATLAVDYGSIDNQFINPADGQMVTLPAGIAHFLEHKMFDKDGYDAFDLFTKYGSDANAYTSFTNTNYLFATTNHVVENLKILLDFVQQPYFTDAKVEKEKGIIAQEIQMYDDDPDSRLFFETIRQLYPHFPLNKDIAGSVDSIQKITAADLDLAYRVFYQPSNMVLKVVGNVDPQAIFDFVAEDQTAKHFAPAVAIERRFPAQQPYQFEATHRAKLGLVRPKAAIGIKGVAPLPTGPAETKAELTLSLLLALLFSENSPVYNRLYQAGVIDDSFSFELDCEREFYFALLTSDTSNPDQFIERLVEVVDQADELIDQLADDFTLVKREKIGQRVAAMNSLEGIAVRLGDATNDYTNVFDEIAIIESIQLADLKAAAHQFLQRRAIATNVFD